MAIANRELDASQQREQTINYCNAQGTVIGTGVTLTLGVIPYNAQLSAIRVAAHGVSGAPTVAWAINRFIAGAGLTTMLGGASTVTITAFTTSGIQSAALVAVGNTLGLLLPGDIIVASTGGSNAAVLDLNIAVVIQPTSDIKNAYNAF